MGAVELEDEVVTGRVIEALLRIISLRADLHDPAVDALLQDYRTEMAFK
jgi:hypothetical protein